MDVDDDAGPKARGPKRKSEAIIMSSDEEEDGPPRKRIVKGGHTPKTALQTMHKSVLDIGGDSEDEYVSTKKKQKPSSKNGPAKTKARMSKVVESESETETTDTKAERPARKKEGPPKKTKGEDKKAEDKQKPE